MQNRLGEDDDETILVKDGRKMQNRLEDDDDDEKSMEMGGGRKMQNRL